MKRFTTAILCLFFLTINAQESKFKRFYENHKEQSAFSINLSSDFAGSFFSDEDNKEIKNLLAKATNFKLMIFNNENNKVSKDLKKFKRKNKLKTLVRAKEKDSRAEVLFLEKNKFVREIIIQASDDEDKVILLGINTKITKEELTELIASKD